MESSRIEELRLYLISLLDDLLQNNDSTINANNLDINTGVFSLDKIPNSSIVEKWINGIELHQDTFLFRSRKSYSQDTINNLNNIKFFEKFEKEINSKNKKGILPHINQIESIECLNCGTLNSIDDNTAEFNIQLRIKYLS